MVNLYPYTDIHELNLDWVIRKMKELKIEFDEFKVINTITFSGAWDITKQYPAWTIVSDNNIGYVSIKPVPAGVLLTNNDYWREVIDYTAQIAGLQNRVVALENTVGDASSGLVKDVDDLQADVTVLNPFMVDVEANTAEYQYITGIIRKTNDGWELVNDAYHKTEHIQSITVDGNGNLVLTYDQTYGKICSFCITPDENLSRDGIVAGATVSNGSATVYLSYTRPFTGGFNVTNGVVDFTTIPTFKNDISSVTINNSNSMTVTFGNYASGSIFINGLLNGTGDFEAKPYRCALTSTGITFTNLGVDLTQATGVCCVTGFTKAAINANDFPVIPSSNFWLFGLMKKNA